MTSTEVIDELIRLGYITPDQYGYGLGLTKEGFPLLSPNNSLQREGIKQDDILAVFIASVGGW